MANLEDKLRPLAEGLVDPGETLLGCCVATQQTTFKGWMVAIAVTEERLILQKLNRRFEANGGPLRLTATDIAEAKAEAAGARSSTPSSLLMEEVAVTLKLKTADGQKLKLMMMRADGSLGMGKLAGGEIQRQGVEALGEWFGRTGGRW